MYTRNTVRRCQTHRIFNHRVPMVSQVRYRGGAMSARKKLARMIQKTNHKYDASSIKYKDLEEVQRPSNFVNSDPELREIIDAARERIHARFAEPNIAWRNSLNIQATSATAIRAELEEKFGARRKHFSASDILSSPLNVGDLVELSKSMDKSELYCVVELPVSLEDPRYTFANLYGDIVFASKSRICTRFPRIFPQEWFKGIILDEKMFNLKEKQIKQIGKPKFLTEDSIIDSSTISFYEQALINNGHDLKQLDTFVMPSIASQILAKDLTRIIADAWDILPIMNSKLELVHNLLQESESPVAINIFQLYQALEAIDLFKAEKKIAKATSFDNLIGYYSQLSEIICNKISLENTYESGTLGRNVVGNFDFYHKFELTSFYAMILALRKNNKLFDGVNNADPAILFPLSINILPLSRTVQADLAIDFYRESDSDFAKLTRYFIERMHLVEQNKLNELKKLQKPLHYDTIIGLLKLYCSSSTRLDQTTECFLIKIFRNLPEYNSMTITPSVFYEALFKLGERTGAQNPVEWSISLAKPFTGTSEHADMEQNFYNKLDLMGPRVAEAHFDQNAALRQDHTSDVIYCIDAETAHEIDDGISISRQDNNIYRIKTYVADPASYLKPEDTIAKIAFERSSTAYFYEEGAPPLEMLPTSFVKSVELRPGDKVRALCFGFLYDTESCTFIQDSMEVTPVYVKNLINITYDDVNAILNGDTSVLKNVSDQRKFVTQETVERDLKDLFEVSSNLFQNRSKMIGPGFKYNDQLDTVSRDDGDDDHLKLTFKEQKFSDSQLLVSEIMVHTNALIAKFLASNNIPTIYRTLQKVPVSEKVALQIDGLDGNSLKDTQKVSNFNSGTSFSLHPISHDMIGLGPYSTVTSPLRRFQDLFTHWLLHSFLKIKDEVETGVDMLPYSEGLMFSEANVAFVLLHISSKTFKMKQVSQRSRSFFIYKKLTELSSTTTFKVMVRSRCTSDGQVEAILLDYGGVRCLLKSTIAFSNRKSVEDIEEHTNQNLNAFSTVRIGDIIEECRIEDIDLITGDIIMTSDNF